MINDSDDKSDEAEIFEEMKNEDVYDFNYPKEIFNKTKKKIVKSK